MLVSEIAPSIHSSEPMLLVRDMHATLAWYQSFGFSLDESHEDDGEIAFARLTLGHGSLTLSPGGNPGPRDVRLWFLMDRVEDLYDAIKQRPDIRFEEELYQPFYGGSQFSVSDCNGVHLIFWRPGDRRSAAGA